MLRLQRIQDAESEQSKPPGSSKEMHNAFQVFSAAQTGRLGKVKIILDGLPKEEAKKLTNKNVNGTTPLVVAARNGHLDVVVYLVDHGADIEQTGQVTFDGETIEGAPPLWSSAAAGHYDIVKYLVRKGADVNHTTKTNSTPLRAACFDGHLEIVKFLVEHGSDIEIANRHGHTCLMISCYKGHYKISKYLLEHKADINRRSTKGNTALHDCAESGSLEIMKLLLYHNAGMQEDAFGMTPLMAASVTGHTSIVEYLVGRADCTSKSRVEALELLGATYVDKKRDLSTALHYWKRAMAERWHVGDTLLLKRDDDDGDVESPLRLRWGEDGGEERRVVPPQTVEDMDELITWPDDMRMYALLVRERNLGPAHPDTSYYIRYRGAVYADAGDFDRCIYLWTYALDMQLKMLEPLNPMTQSSLLSFAELFSFMVSSNLNGERQQQAGDTHARRHTSRCVRLPELLAIFDKTVNELRRGRQHYLAVEESSSRQQDDGNEPAGVEGAVAQWRAHYHRLIIIAMHLISLMCKLRPLTPSLTSQPAEEKRLVHSVRAFLSLAPTGNEQWTPLHFSCFQGTTWVGKYPVQSFPSAQVARLLLDCGADVLAEDAEGNTPLIVAARNDEVNVEVVRTLLEYGAHLDCRPAPLPQAPHQPATGQRPGKSALHLLTTSSSGNGGADVTHHLPPNLNYAAFVSLKCLCARAIVDAYDLHGLARSGMVPARLMEFIQEH